MTAAAGVRPESVDDGAESRYYHYTRPEVRALIPPHCKTLLDVGCGAGRVAKAFKDERPHATAVGIELCEEPARAAADLLDDVIVADLERMDAIPYAHGHFDAIMFADVLEHVHDPHRLVSVLKPYLAPDGVIACSIPNVKHWTVVFDLLVRDRWEYADAGLLDRTHVHFFTLESIDALLQQTGFEAASVSCVRQPMPEQLLALVDVSVGFGADREETLGRLEAYQYLIAATPR